MIEVIIGIAFSAISIFTIFKIWQHSTSSEWKPLSVFVVLSISTAVWVSLFPWEFGVVYCACFLSFFAWVVTSSQLKGRLISAGQPPHKKTGVSISLALRVVIILAVSIVIAGSVSASIALMLPMFSGIDLSNGLVAGLFVFLLIWPVSMVWVISRESILKASLVSTILAIFSVTSVYLVRI